MELADLRREIAILVCKYGEVKGEPFNQSLFPCEFNDDKTNLQIILEFMQGQEAEIEALKQEAINNLAQIKSEIEAFNSLNAHIVIESDTPENIRLINEQKEGLIEKVMQNMQGKRAEKEGLQKELESALSKYKTFEKKLEKIKTELKSISNLDFDKDNTHLNLDFDTYEVLTYFSDSFENGNAFEALFGFNYNMQEFFCSAHINGKLIKKYTGLVSPDFDKTFLLNDSDITQDRLILVENVLRVIVKDFSKQLGDINKFKDFREKFLEALHNLNLARNDFNNCEELIHKEELFLALHKTQSHD